MAEGRAIIAQIDSRVLAKLQDYVEAIQQLPDVEVRYQKEGRDGHHIFSVRQGGKDIAMMEGDGRSVKIGAMDDIMGEQEVWSPHEARRMVASIRLPKHAIRSGGEWMEVEIGDVTYNVHYTIHHNDAEKEMGFERVPAFGEVEVLEAERDGQPVTLSDNETEDIGEHIMSVITDKDRDYPTSAYDRDGDVD